MTRNLGNVNVLSHSPTVEPRELGKPKGNSWRTWPCMLGIRLEMSKLEGPSTCLTFLGIEVDTVANQLHLPAGKLLKLKQELTHCLHRKSITKRELASLTGLLQFALPVV